MQNTEKQKSKIQSTHLHLLVSRLNCPNCFPCTNYETSGPSIIRVGRHIFIVITRHQIWFSTSKGPFRGIVDASFSSDRHEYTNVTKNKVQNNFTCFLSRPQPPLPISSPYTKSAWQSLGAALKNQLKSIKFFWALVMTLSIIAVRALWKMQWKKELKRLARAFHAQGLLSTWRDTSLNKLWSMSI